MSAVERRKLAIVGGGPAGYTAALYAARANLRPLCIEGYTGGGMLMSATERVDNYPGFAAGVMGPDLMMAIREQAERFGAEMLAKDVKAVDLSVWPFRLEAFKAEYEAEAIIVSTGASEKRLELPSEDALEGRGVAYCAACDGAFFAGKRVAVVGGGDGAMDQALSLAKIARELVIVHRRDEWRATDVMVRDALANPNVTSLTPYVVEEILDPAAGRVTGLRLRHAETGEQRVEPFDGVFVAIGHRPSTELFRSHLECDANGYITVTPGRTTTSIDGVFAAGDVQDPVFRQVVTAAGSGCMAALEAERWLAHRGPWALTFAPAAAGTPSAAPLASPIS